MDDIRVRTCEPGDRDALARLRYELWPDHPPEGHAADLAEFFAGNASHMPLENFVAVLPTGQIVGFVEVGLRSHANGCDPHRPVGFIEGWFVEKTYRRRGIGARLIRTAEDWARARGCTEMASDTPVGNDASCRAHERVGYAVVESCANFRKKL